MLRKPSTVFNRLLDRIGEMPVVDCHEHLTVPERDLAVTSREPIAFLTDLYMINDLWSAGASDDEIALLQAEDATTDEKWPLFHRLWTATEHTAYARVTKLALRDVYGIKELTRGSLDKVAEVLVQRDRSSYLGALSNAGVKAVITDVLFHLPMNSEIRHVTNQVLKDYLAGNFQLPETWHPVFPLPDFHEIRQREFVDSVAILARTGITSLEEYEEAVFELMRQARDLGVVAIKDQSAYRRPLSYDLPTRSDAERLFNRLLTDPRNQLAWPEAKPLDDYLFHQFMRSAAELGLPVQIHTGHMAVIRNRVGKANAVNLTSVLELHTEVRFDLFHGNWPYLGDLLFLGKNYPNVTIDLCWVHMVDPIYSQELLKRAVVTVPHAKIHGFGGDYWRVPELAVAHLSLAREVIASALTDLVEYRWLEEEEAIRIAADWLYNNPNRFYNLGMQSYSVT